MTNCAQPIDAVVQLWVESAVDRFLESIDRAVTRVAGRSAAWLVAESTILPNRDHPPVAGLRTAGFSQIVFLGLPPRLAHDEWRDIWQRLHTDVAVDTQSNFEYRQNLVVRALSADAPDYVAVVEECFPAAARFDEAVYYDAVGDPARLAANRDAMAESCARFIDFDRIECMPTSQYDFGPF